MNFKKISIFFSILFLLSIVTNACTTAVISGKYTKNGRPIIWKNRDTNALKNFLKYFSGSTYNYIGLVNSEDPNGKNIWIGMNSVGFAIMNSATYNLSDDSGDGGEGVAMKQALETCETLEDFETYLNNLKRPIGLRANFGVIDAKGGAAFYEVGPDGYVKFDANDPKVAPFGYIIRANYSFTGTLGKSSSGYIRYRTVDDAMYLSQSTAGLSAKDIEQGITKGLFNSLTNRNLYEIYADVPENNPRYEILRDYIPRTSSSSSVVIEGVKPGEDPILSTLWSNVGFPLASIMVPVWMQSEIDMPYVVQYNEKIKDSPICYAALKLKNEKLLNIRWGKFAAEYIDVNALFNKDNTGIHQKIIKVENGIYKDAEKLLAQWRTEGKINEKELKKFYSQTNTLIIETYKNEFDIDLENLKSENNENSNQANSMKGVN
jgi:hypothetical protein